MFKVWIALLKGLFLATKALGCIVLLIELQASSFLLDLQVVLGTNFICDKKISK